MNYNDLKIQFRAVPYASDAHVLEYRVDPDQDITYEKKIKIFGLFKKTVKRKYSTNWIQPRYFMNHGTAYLYTKGDSFNWMPFFIHGQKELDWYKAEFKTMCEFEAYKNEVTNKNIKEWEVEREEYLSRNRIMY